MINKNLSSSFSIILCAYNAEKRLKNTLQHLAFLMVPKDSLVELILVDNNSTDHTQRYALSIWAELGQPFPFHVVEESKPGLSYARRRGVLSAQYQYGIFCDDDNWLDMNYLLHAQKIFNLDSQVGVIGGCSTPVSDVEFPPWFYSKCSSYAVGIQADYDGDISWRKFVWGAGMCFLVEPYQALYLNGVDHLTTGRKGTTLSSGDDGEICAWFIFLGYKIYYSSSLQFKHLMPKERLTNEYFFKFFGIQYPSAWHTYDHYLTVRHFLGSRLRNRNEKIVFVLQYLRSAVMILLNFPEAFQVLALDRKVQKIKNTILSKSLYYKVKP